MSRCDELAAAIEVVAYDRRWAAVATDEARRLSAALGIPFAAIEHVGSTAVPGLMAKPMVDLVVGVADDDAFKSALVILEREGYRGPATGRVGGAFVVVERDGHCVSVHLIEHESSAWRELLAVRDYLRAHPREAEAYGAAKRGIMARPENRRPDVYSGAKSMYMSSLSQRARDWAAQRER